MEKEKQKKIEIFAKGYDYISLLIFLIAIVAYFATK